MKDGFANGARGIIGDFCANAALALGPGIDNWQGIDLAAKEVELRIDGVHAVTGIGSAVLGNPRNSLTWVANFLSGRGIALEAGQHDGYPPGPGGQYGNRRFRRTGSGGNYLRVTRSLPFDLVQGGVTRKLIKLGKFAGKEGACM